MVAGMAMTHDELLAKIDKMNDWDEFDPAYRERWVKNAHKKHKALRAVVELMDKHQTHEGYDSRAYEVIQAIEKELG